MFKSAKRINYISAFFTLICGIMTARYSGAVLQFTQQLLADNIEATPEAIAPLLPDVLILRGGFLFTAMFIMLVIGILALVVNIKNKGNGRPLGIIASTMAIVSVLFMIVPIIGTAYIVVVMVLFVLAGYFRES